MAKDNYGKSLTDALMRPASVGGKPLVNVGVEYGREHPECAIETEATGPIRDNAHSFRRKK